MRPRTHTQRTIVFSPAVSTADELDAALSKQHEVYHRVHRNADGTPQRWRLNGAVKRWKKDRTRIRIPLKYGLYAYGAIESLSEFNDYLALSYEIVETAQQHGA